VAELPSRRDPEFAEVIKDSREASGGDDDTIDQSGQHALHAEVVRTDIEVDGSTQSLYIAYSVLVIVDKGEDVLE
jgi:hypothetical protein